MWTAQAQRRYAWTRRKEGLRLTDPEWALIEPLLPEQGSTGRPWKQEIRRVLHAILHVLRTGCAWSVLPEWAPPRSTVYDWFRRLIDEGWLERLHHTLLMAMREHHQALLQPLGSIHGGRAQGLVHVPGGAAFRGRSETRAVGDDWRKHDRHRHPRPQLDAPDRDPEATRG